MKALVVCKHAANDTEAGMCRLIQHENIAVKYAWKNTLTQKELRGIDFVVAIGGDGTALSASHYLKNTPLLAVNSSPQTSVGALTTISLDKLDEKLTQITRNKHAIEQLERITVKINNKKLPLHALNDVFIAHEKAYLVSRYTVQHKNKKEEQRSSGIIITTGTGSTAWFKSAGGAPFKPSAKYIKMITREPYIGYKHKKFKYKLTRATIKEHETLTIKVATPAVLAIDSIREHVLKPGDTIAIQIAKHPLRRIK